MRIGRAGRLAGIGAGLLLGTLGVLLTTERPGLRVEYHALDPEASRAPVFVGRGVPGIESRAEVANVLVQPEIFALRWRGWIDVPRSGTYRLSAESDEAAFVRLDGERVLRTSAAEGRRRRRVRRELGRGLHQIELGLAQTGGDARLDFAWAPPGAGFTALPAETLYAHRPSWPRRLVRRSVTWPPLALRAAGAAAILGSLLILLVAGRGLLPRTTAPGSIGRPRLWKRAPIRRWLGPVLLAVLFCVAWSATAPFTTATASGDDAIYMEAAVRGEKAPYISNRYVHIYLLRALATLRGGDMFLGSRALWSLTFSMVVAALALAASSLGPRFQIKTFLVAAFLLMSQTTLIGNIGSAFADHTAMMFVTLGFAVYLLGRKSPRPRRHEWHALALGALTVAAFRSKETGIILAWLPLLFLWTDGRVDLRRFARRLAYWLAGAAAFALLLMTVDGVVLGDFWFSLRTDTLAELRLSNFRPEPEQPRTGGGWLHVVWHGHAKPETLNLPLRHLAVMVLAAALAAAIRRKPVELRLLHLMPIVYLAMMMALQVRGTYILSTRYLTPIIPVSCFLAAMLLHHAGLERTSWRALLRPPVLALLGAAVVFVVVVVIPYQTGTLTAAELAPEEALGRLGWKVEDFATSTLAPAVLIAFLAAGVFSFGRRRARVAFLLLGVLGFFGSGLRIDLRSMERRFQVQLGEQTLYPWRVFGAELREDSPEEIVVTRDLRLRYRMGGMDPRTRQRLARAALGLGDLVVRESPLIDAGVSHAIGTDRDLEAWDRTLPGLAETARYDPSGRIVLVEPSRLGKSGDSRLNSREDPPRLAAAPSN